MPFVLYFNALIYFFLVLGPYIILVRPLLFSSYCHKHAIPPETRLAMIKKFDPFLRIFYSSSKEVLFSDEEFMLNDRPSQFDTYAAYSTIGFICLMDIMMVASVFNEGNKPYVLLNAIFSFICLLTTSHIFFFYRKIDKLWKTRD